MRICELLASFDRNNIDMFLATMIYHFRGIMRPDNCTNVGGTCTAGIGDFLKFVLFPILAGCEFTRYDLHSTSLFYPSRREHATLFLKLNN